MREVATQAEEVLRHFHVSCPRGCGMDGVIQGGEGTGFQWTKFFANVDKEVYGVAFSDRRDLPKAEDKRRALEEAATRAQHRLCTMFPDSKFPVGPFKERVAGPAAPEVSGSKKQVLVPKLIQFEDGKPVTVQEHVTTGSKAENIQWASYMASRDFFDALRNEQFRAAVAAAIYGPGVRSCVVQQRQR